MKISKYILTFVLANLCGSFVGAQNTHYQRVNKRYNVFFRINSDKIEEDFSNNKRAISQMKEDIETTLQLDGGVPDSLLILSTASPDGRYEFNKKLAIRRAEITKRLLLEMFPEFKDAHIKVEYLEEDWAGLLQVLKANEDFPQREEMMAIINDDDDLQSKELRLKALKTGWRHLVKNYIYALRNSSITLSVLVPPTEAYDEFVTQVSEFILTPEVLTFDADGKLVGTDGETGVARYYKTIPDDILPEVVSNSSWVDSLTVSLDSTTFSVAPSYSKYPRTTTIDFTIYNKVHTLTVNQEPRDPELILTSSEDLTFDSKGGKEKITYEVNLVDGDSVVVNSNSSFVQVLRHDNEEAVIEVSKNKKKDPRTDKIDIFYEGLSKTVTLSQSPRPFYMAAKTNMLYDLALVPNVGLEFYLGKNMSLVGNWMYSWWKNDNIYWYWRVYGGDLALRYWFGKAAKEKPLQGHHVGLYGQMITYDLELGYHGILADRWSWSAGVEYGYSLPIARRLNIDFTLGLGYHTGEFYEYIPIDGHYVWQATKIRHYIGPTKAEISLVWLLGRGNENPNKGGKK